MQRSRVCCSICTLALGPCGDLPFKSWGRWQCLRGGADGLKQLFCRLRLNIGVGPCWGETCGDMLEAMARVAPSLPKEAMAHIVSRKNSTIYFFTRPKICRLLIPVSAFYFRVNDLARKGVRCDHHHHHQSVTRTHNFTFSLAAVYDGSPL